jgi:hypothetical protein
MATLLSNIQDVCLELGLPVPNAAVSSADSTTLQLIALMNRTGRILSTERNWQVLLKDWRFETVYYQYTGDITAGSSTITNLSSVAGLTTDFMATGAGIQQDSFITSVGVNSAVLSIPATLSTTGATITFGQAQYAMPADFDRIVDKTEYNKTNRWSNIGPKNSQEWQWLKSSFVTTGPRMRYRMQDNKFVLWPMPASKVVMGLEYVSNGWVTSSLGVHKQKFTADDDTSVFPDDLLILGTKLKFFEIKGFDTTTLLQDYAREVSKYMSAEAGSDTLSLGPRHADVVLTSHNIPDSNFGA